MSNTDEPDKKPPPPKTVAWDPADVPRAGNEASAETPPPDPGATVVFTAEDVQKLQEEQAAATEADQQGDRLIGTLIRDKWRVLEKLGAGSFGTVYKVEDVKGGWVEALKILGVDRMTGAEAEEMRARFLREAQIMKRLGGDSQHIVGLSTYEEDIEAGLIYFLMEFVEGKSLARALGEEGPFSVDRTVEIGLQVCDALMAAHEGPEPVVHRDLKLENLMLTQGRDGEEMVKVLDFGIAKIAERDADSRLTTVGTLGTPGYAAPEQLRAEPVDGRTDLFAFGVILYALLTGRDPWLGNLAHEPTHQIYELMVATDRAEVRPMGATGASIPPSIVNVVMKLLRRDPAQRFQSARELRDALRRLREGGTGMVTGSPGGITGFPGMVTGSPGSVTGSPGMVTGSPGSATGRGTAAGAPTAGPRGPGAAQDVAGAATRREAAAPPRPRARKSGRKGRLVVAVLVLLAVGAAAYAQPWGRTLDPDALLSHIQRGSISEVYVTEGGLEGGLQVVPVDVLSDFRTPFFVSVDDGRVPEVVRSLRDRGVAVDASWEIRRLTGLAVAAQSRSRYYGLEGGDVRSYALRLAELAPESPEAASLLLKVGERMAWDAEAALQDGAPEMAGRLIDECLALIPDHPRCNSVAESL